MEFHGNISLDGQTICDVDGDWQVTSSTPSYWTQSSSFFSSWPTTPSFENTMAVRGSGLQCPFS